MTSSSPALHFRPLEASDYDKGYLSVLGQLTEVGTISKEAFEERVAELSPARGYHILVHENEGRVVASGTLLIEKKFIHGCGKVGHIEDIVVLDTQRGRNVGRQLVETLVELGKSQGCYKVILDCSQANSGFYERCGLVVKGVQMAKYFDH